jgi:hypothetical protein
MLLTKLCHGELVNRLVEKIRELAGIYSLSSYDWPMPKRVPIDIPMTVQGNYEINIFLKENLSNVITLDQELDIHYWIIQDWGGIGSFKRNDANDKRIIKFLTELDNGVLTKHTFSAISSLSKIASFLNPEDYVIYDSRVIYALNWMIFNYSDSSMLFPQPQGRSAKLTQYDMQTIFRLSGRSVEYYSHEEAFHRYCELIKDLSSQLNKQFSTPYALEMFIFMISPEWTVSDIERLVSIEIDQE